MQTFNVTSAGISAERDRVHRMKVYFIIMSIRVVSVLSLLVLRGWWLLLAIIGGVVLPYIAVMIANVPNRRAEQTPDQPEPAALTTVRNEEGTPSPPIIIVDGPVNRRSSRGKSAGNLERGTA